MATLNWLGHAWMLVLLDAPALADAPERAPASSIDRSQIREVVRAHLGAVRACYAEGLARDPTLAGRVAIRFTIAHDGRVRASSVVSSTLTDAAVGECVADAALGWRFAGGAEIVITYPFVFEPG